MERLASIVEVAQAAEQGGAIDLVHLVTELLVSPPVVLLTLGVTVARLPAAAALEQLGPEVSR